MKIQRTLSPTAAPIPLSCLLRGLLGLVSGTRYRERLEKELKQQYSAHAVFLLSSGKAALTLILKALASGSERRRVVIPAYTCFSVPSAIVKADLEIVLCDVDPETLDFKFDELKSVVNDEVLCVLPTHLFGLAANVARTRELCREHGVVVVEDAAQALGGESSAGPTGTMGDVAFFSLGRGKNLTSGSGGIILSFSPVLTNVIESEFRQVPEPPLSERIRNWVETLFMKVFIHPGLYWFPAGLPFLGLGETKFYTDYPIFRMDEVRAALLQGWSDRLDEANRDRRVTARRLMDDLGLERRDVRAVAPSDSVYLRLPLFMRDRTVKEWVCKTSRGAGAGISPSYPTTVQDIPQLAGRIPVRRVPGAQEIVERLVTLPTHRFVTQRDIRKLDRILSREGSATAVPLHEGTTADERRRRPCSVPLK
ncbi:MAG TPA: DegT/DnrJ/EryC1/StrS family aminotransferase [Nitrospira sp.]|nr:DegT/DnrJ/EryC1/StrS family aminotransferase [Nitrospira sp.]